MLDRGDGLLDAVVGAVGLMEIAKLRHHVSRHQWQAGRRIYKGGLFVSPKRCRRESRRPSLANFRAARMRIATRRAWRSNHCGVRRVWGMAQNAEDRTAVFPQRVPSDCAKIPVDVSVCNVLRPREILRIHGNVRYEHDEVFLSDYLWKDCSNDRNLS